KRPPAALLRRKNRDCNQEGVGSLFPYRPHRHLATPTRLAADTEKDSRPPYAPPHCHFDTYFAAEAYRPCPWGSPFFRLPSASIASMVFPGVRSLPARPG